MKKIKASSGTTMVELLVAVVVILLMVTMFSATVAQAADFLNKAYEMQDKVESFNREYYKKSAFEERNKPSNCCALDVSLKLDREKTADTNNLQDSINLSHTRLQKYTYNEEGIANGMGMFSYQIEQTTP